jgi:hypothetical protein
MIDLTRRKLLKFVGLGALAAIAPVPAKTAKAGPLTWRDHIPIEHKSVESWAPGFNPDLDYGRAAQCNGMKDDFVIRHLHGDAKGVLPKGTPYELRLTWEYPGGIPSMAWYYCPLMLWDTPAKGVNSKSWKYIPEYGCYIMGRFYT